VLNTGKPLFLRMFMGEREGEGGGGLYL